MSGYIKTMKDLEAATYGYGGNSGNALLKAGGVVGGFGSPHDAGPNGSNPFTAAAGLGDLYNVLYGQKVWSMLNQEVNPLSMIAKRPYTSSGWRVLKSRPIGGSGSNFATGSNAVTANISSANAATPRADTIGGVGENAVIGTDFHALAPEYTKLFVSPKTIAHLFEFSELGMELAAIDDGVGDIRAIVREDMGKLHAEVQSKMLVMPLEKYNENGTTGIEKNYTSLLKIVSSAAELAMMQEDNVFHNSKNNDGTFAQITDAASIYGSERVVTVAGSSGSFTYTAVPSFLDAEVDFGAGYATGDCRVLTLSLLNDMIRKIRQNGGNPKVIVTGYDTIQKLSDLLQAQERFMDRKEIVPTHNGVRGVKGQEVGFRVATYYDIPIIPAKDMPATGLGTTNRISDILILDTDHLWLSVMKPTQYFEDGITSGNPFGVGKLGNQGMYRTMGETCCSFFKGQGKITNLKSA
jgi:hypothetical protein